MTELDKSEVEIKSTLEQMSNRKKDERIQMLEKANELDQVRDQMKECLAEFQILKSKRNNAKETLKCAENILSQKSTGMKHTPSLQILSSDRTKNDSTLDLEDVQKDDSENTDPNIDQALSKFNDSCANVIFQSPVADVKPSKRVDEDALQSFVLQKETPALINTRGGGKRSLSRAAATSNTRASCMINPLTESYDCRNANLDRYNSMKSFGKKPRRKSKNRNSYRCVNNNSSNGMIQNMRSPLIQNVRTEPQETPNLVQLGNLDHRKSTKMLIDCLLKQLNPVTAYMTDSQPKVKPKPSKNKQERSRNENTSSMFMDIQQRMRQSQDKHMSYMGDIRSNTSHYTMNTMQQQSDAQIKMLQKRF